MTKPKIGLQVFSMRDIWAKNPIEAFQIAKDCGYDAVEGIGRFTMGANELRKVLDDFGLECCGWHTPWEYLSKPDLLEMCIAYNQIIGNKYIITTGFSSEYWENKEKWLEGCEKGNEISARLKKDGMFLGVHFEPSARFSVKETGELYWDILVGKTADFDVVMQLDTGNSYAGGYEPVAVLKKHKNRYQTVHFKPYSLTKNYNAPIGEDDTDWAEMVKYLKEYGDTEYFIIEYEQPDAKAGVKTCIDYIRKII